MLHDSFVTLQGSFAINKYKGVHFAEKLVTGYAADAAVGGRYSWTVVDM